MQAKTVKKNNVHLHAIVGRAINKLFHGIEKYKIRSCIIYLTGNQASSPSIHEREKLGLDLTSPNDANNTYIVG